MGEGVSPATTHNIDNPLGSDLYAMRNQFSMPPRSSTLSYVSSLLLYYDYEELQFGAV